MKEILLNLLALVLTALTPGGGEIPPELQSEIDSLKAAIDGVDGSGGDDPPTNQAEVTNALLQRLTDLTEKVKNSATKTDVIDKLTEVKFVAVNAAMKAFNLTQKELGKGIAKVKNHNFDALIKNNGKLKVYNVNNANFQKSIEEEFSMSYVLRQTGWLRGLMEKVLPEGSNMIVWTEGVRGANGAAIVAIGADKPVKVNTNSVPTLGLSTLAEQNTVPVQLLRGLNGVEQVYKDDLEGDLQDKIALQVAAVLVAANNPLNITTTVNVGIPNISDVIESAYWQLKPYANGKPIVVCISSQQQKALNLLKDKNENKLAKLSYPDLAIENFIATATYTDDMIFGWVENLSIRFYNDGVWIGSDELNGRGVSGDNFKKNQITLMAEYLNEGLVIRSTDVVTTIYDSIAATILELTAGA
jgi:hypothetical protein